MKKIIQGIIPPLVTPLIDNETIDIAGLERLIEHVISGGVHGIFILGTTGEAQSLSIKLRMQMIRESSRCIRKRIPMLVGISDTSINESMRLHEVAYESDAYAVVSTPPFYFSMNQEEVIHYYETLIPQLKLPLYLYNIPQHTKISFAPKTINLIAKNPQVIGFKDSSGNAPYFHKIMHEMRNNENFSLFVGPEEMTAEMVILGADGGVNGGANLFPKLYVDLYHAAKKGDIEIVKKIQSIIMRISSSIYAVEDNGSSYLRGLKCALGILNICSDVTASPFCKFDAINRQKVKTGIEDILDILSKSSIQT